MEKKIISKAMQSSPIAFPAFIIKVNKGHIENHCHFMLLY